MEGLGAATGEDAAGTAERILQRMAETISDSAMAFVHAINARPLYTIREVLERPRVEPEAIVLIGGPAPQMAPYLERALGLPCRVPPHYGVANALGAAVARVTTEVTLQADTERGTLCHPGGRPLPGNRQPFHRGRRVQPGAKGHRGASPSDGSGSRPSGCHGIRETGLQHDPWILQDGSEHPHQHVHHPWPHQPVEATT